MKTQPSSYKQVLSKVEANCFSVCSTRTKYFSYWILCTQSDQDINTILMLHVTSPSLPLQKKFGNTFKILQLWPISWVPLRPGTKCSSCPPPPNLFLFSALVRTCFSKQARLLAYQIMIHRREHKPGAAGSHDGPCLQVGMQASRWMQCS